MGILRSYQNQLYQQRPLIDWHYKHRYFITCHPGLEQVVARELQLPQIDAPHVEAGKAGVYFSGQDDTLGYRASLWSRAGIRVLSLLAEGPIDSQQRGADQVYEFCRENVEWCDLIPDDTTISWGAHVNECSDLRTPILVQQRLRDAVCDSIRDRRGKRPSPPEGDGFADILLHAVAHRDYLMLYRQMNYESLHKRGYKSSIHRASLNESAACGILYLSGWNEENEDAFLADPMCGSGTIVIEAALMAKQIAPGLLRKGNSWPFVKWSDFRSEAWKQILQEAVEIQSQNKWKGRLLGIDEYKESVAMARQICKFLNLKKYVKIERGSCGEVELSRCPNVVITNPPWGARLKLNDHFNDEQSLQDNGVEQLGYSQQLEESWKQLGYFLKSQCSGAEAYILSGNKDLTQYLRLKSMKRYPITLGGIDCRLIKYQVGKHRAQNQDSIQNQ